VAHLIEVAFKGNRREFFLWDGESPPPLHAHVIVEADRGEDLGTVHAVGDLAALRAKGCTHGLGNAPASQLARRLAQPEDIRRITELRAQDDDARRTAITLVREQALEMKITDAEWRWDRRKLTFYFTAEKRIDFRALVRDLAGKFRARIELKQIGVRDEAKRLDGIGRCGRQYCSASFLTELRPISLGLAKIQKLSLNPTQISGTCGRLMCCLRFEHDWYVETRRRFPKEGKPVTTALGEEKVVVNDLFRERVTLRRMSDGELRTIPLAQLDKELRGEPIEIDVETDTVGPESWSDELLSMTDTVERPIPRDARPARPQSPKPSEPQRPARPPVPKPSERPVRLAKAPRRDDPSRPPRAAAAATPDTPAPPSSTTTPRPAPPAPEQGGETAPARGRRRRGRRGGKRGNDGGPSTPRSGDSST